MSDCGCALDGGTREQYRVLWILLAINGGMFVVEAAAGWVAQSTALLADSLDMFADAAVYGVALFGVSRGLKAKAGAAMTSGVLQLVLGLGALAEVARRAIYGSDPEGSAMMGVALLALVANVWCFALISRHKSGGVHMRATWICSRNDVLANAGVIGGGGLVAWIGSAWPDLVLGTAIGLLVIHGGVAIIREARAALTGEAPAGAPAPGKAELLG